MSMPEPRYFDVRRVRGRTTQIEIENGAVESSGISFSDESIVRVLGANGWGTVSSENFDPDAPGALREAISMALSLAMVTGRRVDLAPAPHARAHAPVLKENPVDVSLEEKTALLLQLERAARLEGIASTRAMYVEHAEAVRLVTSEGVDEEYRITRCGFSVSAVARRGDQLQLGRESRYSVEGFNLRHREGLAEEAGRRALSLLNASPARGGRMNVVLDPELAGVFAHEAVGHASEGDLVREGNSVLSGRIGEQIGVEELTIADDPTLHEFGFEPLDAEGTSVAGTEIISRGRVNAFLHSRETAAALGQGVNGHARALPGEPPLVRMSNTFIRNGDSDLEELVRECRTGMLLKGSRGGQVDPGRGIFQFNAEYGFVIAHGELGRMVRDVSISGEILRTLHTIRLIGNDLKMHQGYCGKGGQTVPVSDGSPHVLLLDAVVGGIGDD